jgi:hypothetical protein
MIVFGSFQLGAAATHGRQSDSKTRPTALGARPMPRFYFNVVYTAQSIVDLEGTDLPGLGEARSEAIKDARELMSRAILEGRDISGRSIDIFSEEGHILMRLPFREAFSPED